MTMRQTTVRFGDELWRLLEREAQRDGVSAAQFVRDATLLRIGLLTARRGGRGPPASVAGLLERAHQERRPSDRDDPNRLAVLRAAGLLEDRPIPGLDRISRLARSLLAAAGALISVVADDHELVKSSSGLTRAWPPGRRVDLAHSLARYAIERGDPLAVSDTRAHPVLRESGAVTELGVIAYAAVPLMKDGHALGVLGAIDERPRLWSAEQMQLLADLAQITLSEIRLAGAAAGASATVAAS